MKILFISLFFVSLQASAVALISEAICEGKLEGKSVSVQGLVNPNNWCEVSANDNNSAILLKEGNDISVFTSITSEVERSDDIVISLISSESNAVAKLTYIIEGVPGSGTGTLELIDGTETISVDLKCDFPEYHTECK